MLGVNLKLYINQIQVLAKSLYPLPDRIYKHRSIERTVVGIIS